MELVDDGRVEPGELLEETWFFGNSLHGKSRMSTRRHSHPPCPSTSNSIQAGSMNLVADEKSMEQTYSSIKKIPEATLTRAGPALMKTTSMPTNKESSTRIYSTMKKQQIMQCGRHLSRALSSLPTFAEKEEFEEDDDEESEFCMGKLIRQASLNHARVQPPLPSVKGLRRSCSISIVPKQTNSKITGCDYEEEIKQGKVTLGRKSAVYDNRTEGLNKRLMSLKLQERDEENVIRRRNCSELAWIAKSCGTPPTPFQKSSSSGQDMKAQIKFWARAVASNVRQEC
nr:uncharacterized protein LOC109187574 [Ipomoea batatas]